MSGSASASGAARSKRLSRGPDVFVAIVGRRWADAADGTGRRRLDDADDVLRNELETAVRTDGALLIPVMVDGATTPPDDAVPARSVPSSNGSR